MVTLTSIRWRCDIWIPCSIRFFSCGSAQQLRHRFTCSTLMIPVSAGVRAPCALSASGLHSDSCRQPNVTLCCCGQSELTLRIPLGLLLQLRCRRGPLSSIRRHSQLRDMWWPLCSTSSTASVLLFFFFFFFLRRVPYLEPRSDRHAHFLSMPVVWRPEPFNLSEPPMACE